MALMEFNAGRFGVHTIPETTTVVTSLGPVAIRDTGGRGKVWVLVHGWAADSALNWFSLYQPLSDHGRVIAVDLPGHGQSPLKTRFTLKMAAAAVSETLASLQISDYTPVGYSMGGPVIQLLAATQQKRIKGCCYVATAAHIVPSQAVNRILVTADAAFGVGAGALDTLVRLASRDMQGSSLSLWGHAGQTARHTNKRALLQAGRELAVYDARPWIGDLTVATTSVITTKDRTVSQKAQEELASLTRAHIVGVPFGHAFCLDKTFASTMVETLTEKTCQ